MWIIIWKANLNNISASAVSRKITKTYLLFNPVRRTDRFFCVMKQIKSEISQTNSFPNFSDFLSIRFTTRWFVVHTILRIYLFNNIKISTVFTFYRPQWNEIHEYNYLCISFMHLHHIVNRGQTTSKHPLLFTSVFNKAPLLFSFSFYQILIKLRKSMIQRKHFFFNFSFFKLLKHLCTK